MIWSVSMSSFDSTTVFETICFTASMVRSLVLRRELARIDDRASYRGCRSGDGARKHRARARALPAFEVAVAGADGELAGGHGVAIHADAHRAPGLAPLAA